MTPADLIIEAEMLLAAGRGRGDAELEAKARRLLEAAQANAELYQQIDIVAAEAAREGDPEAAEVLLSRDPRGNG